MDPFVTGLAIGFFVGVSVGFCWLKIRYKKPIAQSHHIRQVFF